MNSAEHTVFAIENNTLPLGRNAPRIGIVGSKYPIAEINIGDAFNIPVKDKRDALQKRSYLLALAKSREVKISTSFFPEGYGDDSQPVLRVRKDGLRASAAGDEEE
jgi:hypothetical protein